MSVSPTQPASRAVVSSSASSPTSATAPRSPNPQPSPSPSSNPGQVKDGFDPAPTPSPSPGPSAKAPEAKLGSANPGERPAALGDRQILDSAKQYLQSKGRQVPGTDADVRKLFREDSDLRRDFLFAKGMEDRGRGATALEMFSNVVQRSRSLLTTGEGDQRQIDGKEVGKDVGLLFAGTDAPGDGIPKVGTQNMNHRWNLSRGDPNVEGDGLKPTGFKQDRLNDDGGADEDQTHHIAFYTMVGGAWDNWLGEKAAKAAVRVADRGHPNDIRLGDDGIELGRALDDPKLDVNAWIWDRAGDPSNR